MSPAIVLLYYTLLVVRAVLVNPSAKLVVDTNDLDRCSACIVFGTRGGSGEVKFKIGIQQM